MVTLDVLRIMDHFTFSSIYAYIFMPSNLSDLILLLQIAHL